MSSSSNTPEREDQDPVALKTPTKTSFMTSKGNGKENTEPPSTHRKPDVRRRYGVRITDDEPSADISDSLDESEAELQRGRQDISQSHDTTGGDFSINDSGVGGARQAISRRSAAGISLKDSEARIKKLEAENNELRIECDLWRQQMKPEEAQIKLVTISKELIKVRKSNVDFMKLLKEQDSSIKESRKILKRWGDLDPREEQKRRRELEQKLEDVHRELEEERRSRRDMEEELELVRNREPSESQDSPPVVRLQQMLEDQRDDHEEAMYHLRRERDELEARLDAMEGESRSRNRQGDEDLEDEIADLQQQLKAKDSENEKLSERLDELQEIRSRQDFEIEDLQIKLQQSLAADDSHSRELEVAHQRLEHYSAGHHQDIAEQIALAEQAVEQRLSTQMDRLRDEVTGARLDLQTKSEEIDTLQRQQEDDGVKFQEMELELERAAGALEERVEEIEQLNDELDELNQEYHKIKRELDDADEEIRTLLDDNKLKAEELSDANQELQVLSEKLFASEEDVDALRQDVRALEVENQELSSELQAARERSERREGAYKERLSQVEQVKADIESQLLALERDYQNAAEDSRVLGRDVDGLQQEKKDLEAELENVYVKLDDATEEWKDEQRKREQLEDEMDRKLEEMQVRCDRLVDEKEEEISSLVRELEAVQEMLTISKEDIAKLQDVMRRQEDESVRLGQSHDNDRYSLELEIDRLKRDLGRAEADIERLRREAGHKDDTLKEKESKLNDLYFENRSLASKFAAENQTRLGLEERMEAQLRTLTDAHREVAEVRAKMEQMEEEANMGEKSLMQTEQHIKSQLTERNTLLLTIYQYMGKILGPSVKRKGDSDLKPFTNFAVFHDNLISRLRKVSDVQLQFDQKAKTIEEKFSEKFTALKRQQDTRFRQIDRFEVAIKNAVDKQGQWRSRLVTKQTEMDALRSTNNELQAQISSLRTRSQLASPGETNKLNALSARANNAERKLTAAQNQSIMAEERLVDAKNKYAEGEGKWSARIKELESRLKAAEERVKRERQGAKERVAELEEEKQRLQRSLDAEKKRAKVLESIQSS